MYRTVFSIGIFLTGPLVSTPGETANFVCQPRGGSTSITNLQWLINETLVETLQLNATRTFEFGIGTLTFNNILLNYNGTRITCDANVNSDVSVTQHSILYVQGKYIIAPTPACSTCTLTQHNYYPARACASKGLCDRSWCPYSSIYLQGLFSIFQNTHFQTPISAQEGFSSNLIAFSIP